MGEDWRQDKRNKRGEDRYLKNSNRTKYWSFIKNDLHVIGGKMLAMQTNQQTKNQADLALSPEQISRAL